MTRLLGHRGARAHAPENTLVSLHRAIADGAEGFEFDVRATRDGIAVLLHDASLDRTTNGRGLLAHQDRSDLDGLDAGVRFGRAFAGERIPTLDEVLDEFLGRVTLAIEMKETLPDATLRDLAARLPAGPAETMLASFQPQAVARARDLVPELPRVLVLERDRPVPAPEVRAELDLRGLFARHESIDVSFVAACRDAGLALFAYTVNDPAEARRLTDLSVDGIISDDPGAINRAV